METKIVYQSSLQKIFFIAVILLFSFQALCSETNAKTTTKKSETKQQSENKDQAVKITKPKVSPSSFRPDMPLREAINILRNCTNPPLNIVVKWKDLDENADINPETLIGMDGLNNVSIGTHLGILLMSLSTETAELGYIVDGNVIVIGVKENLPKKMVTRVYDVADIVAPPSMANPMMGMGMMGMGGIGMGNMGMMGMNTMGMSPYGNMMGYGNMSPYGNMSGLNPYGSGYNQSYMNRGNTTQGNRSYGNMNTPMGIGIPMM